VINILKNANDLQVEDFHEKDNARTQGTLRAPVRGDRDNGVY
jgi:hypothetical protein